MRTRWECRYSSCEMMYLEVVGSEVRCWLDHSPNSGDRFSFDQVLAGACDSGEIPAVFGSDVVEELKAAVREMRGDR